MSAAAEHVLREAAAQQRRLAVESRTSNGHAEHTDFADWLEERADLVAGGSVEGGGGDAAVLGLVTSGEQGLGTCSPTAAPVVTDEAVEQIARKWAARYEYDVPNDNVDWQDFLAEVRKDLEAAAPLLGPKPLLDRDALTAAFIAFRERNGGCPDGPDCADCREIAGEEADIALKLARPMPTREQIEAAVRAAGIGSYSTIVTEAVLALLNGAVG